jgi:hypothetical protein
VNLAAERRPGSVSAVIARRPVRISLLALSAAATLAASGCSTFDNDVVARVGDAELSSAELEGRLGPVADPVDPAASLDVDRVDGQTARDEVAEWVRTEVIRSAGIADRYADDHAGLGIACLDVIVTSSAQEADSILGDVNGGGDWDEAAAPSEATFGYETHLQCQPLAEWAPQVSPTFAEFVADLEPGGPAQVADLEVGQWVVARAQAFDDIDMFGLLTVMQVVAPDQVEAILDEAAAADVYVDPRFGDFDAIGLAVNPVD